MDFTKSHDVVMAAQQRDLVLQRVDDVEASYRQTQVEMSETEHRVHELQCAVGEVAGADHYPGSHGGQSGAAAGAEGEPAGSRVEEDTVADQV